MEPKDYKANQDTKEKYSDREKYEQKPVYYYQVRLAIFLGAFLLLLQCI